MADETPLVLAMSLFIDRFVHWLLKKKFINT